VRGTCDGPTNVPHGDRLMTLAIKYERLRRKGVVADLSDLARYCQITQTRVTQIVNLLHLAADIPEALPKLPEVPNDRDPITLGDLRPFAMLPSSSRPRSASERCRKLTTREPLGGCARPVTPHQETR